MKRRDKSPDGGPASHDSRRPPAGRAAQADGPGQDPYLATHHDVTTGEYIQRYRTRLPRGRVCTREMHTMHKLQAGHRPSALAAGVATFAILAAAMTPPARADNGTDTRSIRNAVSAEAIINHLEALQAIADANDGTRAAGTPGHVASAEYIEEQLSAAGFITKGQYFDYLKFFLDGEAFERLTPTPRTYTADDFLAMSYSGFGDVSATVTPVDINLAGNRASTSGCEATDFVGFPTGHLALIQRGTCTFNAKAVNAEAPGPLA